MGPYQARLESLGDLLQIVVAAFGEEIAESRVLYLSRQEGRPITDA